jgi:hypothetical protein
LLSARSAAILGASCLIAAVAGVLAYLTLGKSPADLAGAALAALAAGTAFAGAVRLLMAIVARPGPGPAPRGARARGGTPPPPPDHDLEFPVEQ